MPLVEAKCPNCGASLKVDDTKDAAICEYCSTPYIVEKAVNGVISNSNVYNPVINVITNEDKKAEKELSEKEMYERYLEEYKAIRKDIRKSKLKHFLVALILAVVCAIAAIIAYNLDDSVKWKIPVLVIGFMGAPSFFVVGLKSLVRFTSSDIRRIQNLNNAYEQAHFKKKFK